VASYYKGVLHYLQERKTNLEPKQLGWNAADSVMITTPPILSDLDKSSWSSDDHVGGVMVQRL